MKDERKKAMKNENLKCKDEVFGVFLPLPLGEGGVRVRGAAETPTMVIGIPERTLT